MKNQQTKLYLAFKILTSIAFVVVVAFTVLYFIQTEHAGLLYFKKHFVISIVLFFVGIIAFFLPKLNQKSFQGENKGDGFMVIVAILLFLCSILTCVFSYL